MGIFEKLNPTNLITGALGAISGASSAAINAKQQAANRDLQYKMFQEQNAFNAEQAQLSYERNRDEWNRQFNLQNSYNDPSSQFQRYLNAGFNPYMSLGSFNNAASASAQGSSPATSASFPGNNMYPNNPVSDFLQGLNSSMQTSLSVLDALKGQNTFSSYVDALNSKNNRDSLYNDLDIDMFGLKRESMEQLLKSQNAKNSYDQSYYTIKLSGVPDIVANELAQLITQTNILRETANDKFYSANERRLAYEYLNETFNIRKKILYKQFDLNKAQIRQIDNGINVSNELARNSIRETDSIIYKNQKDIEYNFARLAIEQFLSRHQANLMKSQRNSLDAKADYDWQLSTLALPHILRGYKLDNDYKEIFNKRYPILSAPTPEQWLNYMATDGGSAVAGALYGLSAFSHGASKIVSPWSDLVFGNKFKNGFGFPKPKR